MTTAPTENGEAGALSLLTSSFLGGGIPGGVPSLNGGDAGPAISSATSDTRTLFNNPFSIADNGSSSSANADGNASGSSRLSNNTTTYVIAAIAAIALLMNLKK